MIEELPEHGWRVHAALESWTSKVDGKASIALAIEAAILGYSITLGEPTRALAILEGWWLASGVAGWIALSASTLLSVTVVFPQLRGRKTRKNWESNTIYFGHLRFWDPTDLADSLDEPTTTRIQLANQLVVMAKIAWSKHVLLQWSLILLVAGSVLLVVAGLGQAGVLQSPGR